MKAGGQILFTNYASILRYFVIDFVGHYLFPQPLVIETSYMTDALDHFVLDFVTLHYLPKLL
jgi:hypothetical protein